MQNADFFFFSRLSMNLYMRVTEMTCRLCVSKLSVTHKKTRFVRVHVPFTLLNETCSEVPTEEPGMCF